MRDNTGISGIPRTSGASGMMEMSGISLLNKLARTHALSVEEYETLLSCFYSELIKENTLRCSLSENTARHSNLAEEAARKAVGVRQAYYGTAVFTRGLIEVSNYCKNDCLYCGIRKSNKECSRYRLSLDDIYACATEGYELGFRTFVLQGGEDPWFSDERLREIVSTIKTLIQIVQLRFRWAKERATVINAFLKRARIGIYYGTKRLRLNSIKSFILKECHLKTACVVCKI